LTNASQQRRESQKNGEPTARQSFFSFRKLSRPTLQSPYQYTFRGAAADTIKRDAAKVAAHVKKFVADFHQKHFLNNPETQPDQFYPSLRVCQFWANLGGYRESQLRFCLIKFG
jgi:hypothetical protein